MKNEVKTDDLSYLGTDPGAVKFGNFINYYSFHNVQERMDKLHPQMFPKYTSKNIYCLDIGCNTGDLTKQLYQYLKSIYTDHDIYILGIDIDPTLIQRAQETNDNQNVKFITGDIIKETDLIQKHLTQYERDRFDITFCFSVTMWIHINNGDKGLMKFLSYIQNISRAIIIEPQPWNCYRGAQRRLKKSGSSFQHYEHLKLRSAVDSVIENKLLEGDFTKVYESAFSTWNRKIHSYHCKE